LLNVTELKGTFNSHKEISLKPNWDYARERDHDKLKIMDVPLFSRGLFGFTTLDAKRAYEETKDDRFMLSSTKLIITSNKRTKSRIAFFMTIIPDQNYRIEKNHECFNSSYKKWQEDFSGFIIYHNIDGSFSNGWRLINGITTHTVEPKEQSVFTLDLEMPTEGSKDYICNYYELIVWYQDCIDWYQIINNVMVYTNTSCGAPYSEVILTFSVCEYVGGISSTDPDYIPSSPQDSPYVPQPNDKFCRSDFSHSMSTQLANLCVPSIMEYINHNLCHGAINQGVYIIDYRDMTGGNWAIDDGVDLEDVEDLVSRHFSLSPFRGFTNEINRGRVVMTDIPSNIPDSYHNVAGIGYPPDGTLIFMDPEKGSLQEAPASYFGANYRISINGCL
jgi:hypothetical protein